MSTIYIDLLTLAISLTSAIYVTIKYFRIKGIHYSMKSELQITDRLMTNSFLRGKDLAAEWLLSLLPKVSMAYEQFAHKHRKYHENEDEFDIWKEFVESGIYHKIIEDDPETQTINRSRDW